MQKFLEIFEQQDGGLCVLQIVIGAGFALFWLAWAIVSIVIMQLAEIPTNLGLFLAAALAAKIWKDKVDNQVPPTS